MHIQQHKTTQPKKTQINRKTCIPLIDTFLIFLVLLLVIVLIYLIQLLFPLFYEPTQKNNQLTIPSSSDWDPSLPRTSDQQLLVQVDLSTVYKGENSKVTVNKRVICSSCEGTGASSPEHLHVCPSCGGKGYQDVIQQMGFMRFQTQQPCSACGGKGKRITELCPKCHGSGIHYHKEVIDIPIPVGIPEGFVIKLAHGADQQPLHAPGDLYLHIQTISTQIPEMRRDGIDLHYELSISLLEALVGFKKHINHFFGEFLIERSEVTSHGQVLVFPSKGMPIFKEEGKFGTLFIHITVDFPYLLTAQEILGVKALLGDIKTDNTETEL